MHITLLLAAKRSYICITMGGCWSKNYCIRGKLDILWMHSSLLLDCYLVYTFYRFYGLCPSVRLSV